MHEVSMEIRRRRGSPYCIPNWVKDTLVLQLFDDCGFRVEVVYDEKYLYGMSDKPLILIRKKPKLKCYK